ncbi:hypothetical protein GGI35DRAFT_259733 [Trichoderma velutinum]
MSTIAVRETTAANLCTHLNAPRELSMQEAWEKRGGWAWAWAPPRPSVCVRVRAYVCLCLCLCVGFRSRTRARAPSFELTANHDRPVPGRMRLPPRRDPVRTPLVALCWLSVPPAVCASAALSSEPLERLNHGAPPFACYAPCPLCLRSTTPLLVAIYELLLDQDTKRRTLDRNQASPGHETSLMKHLTICGEQSKPLLSAMSQRPFRRPLCTLQAPAHEQQTAPPTDRGSRFEQRPKRHSHMP